LSADKIDWIKLDHNTKFNIQKRLFGIFVDSMLNDGIYHLDLHTGNFIYQPEDDFIYLIDFGLMGQESGYSKEAVTKAIGFLTETPPYYDGVADILIGLNFIVDDKNTDMYRKLKMDLINHLKNDLLDNRIDLLTQREKQQIIRSNYPYKAKIIPNYMSFALFCLDYSFNKINPNYKMVDLQTKL
jgi:predicted unusual protein kinase regulating ubiquinone biosynthesis (AarF/ABC1/UbiB family)